MQGLIIAMHQNKEKNLCKFLSKRAFSYLYVVNLLATNA
jgi:hypothetical protein